MIKVTRAEMRDFADRIAQRLGFPVSWEILQSGAGILWPQTGITAKQRDERLAQIVRITGKPVRHGLFIEV